MRDTIIRFVLIVKKQQMGSYVLKIVPLDIAKLGVSIIHVKNVSAVNFLINGTSINVKTGEIAQVAHTFLLMAQAPRTVIALAVHLENFLLLPMH